MPQIHQSAALGIDRHLPADGIPQGFQHGPVCRQFPGKEFREAAADIDAAGRRRQGGVGQRAERLQFRAPSGQQIQRILIVKAESLILGDGDAGADWLRRGRIDLRRAGRRIGRGGDLQQGIQVNGFRNLGGQGVVPFPGYGAFRSGNQS